MASRLQYYFRQRVSEAELNLGFELLEQADRHLASDIGVFGVIQGAVAVPRSPVADLSIELTAPARAYDRLGQRIFFGTGQRVDCSVDHLGVPTDVSTQGNERWLGVFLRFDRLLSSPRIDGNSQQIFFRQDESFALIVRQGPEAGAGSASKVGLVADELLLCDVLRRHGQTQIVSGDIDGARRQHFVFAVGDAVAVNPGGWTALLPATSTVQAALDATDHVLAGHLQGSEPKHAAHEISVEPAGPVTARDVQGALGDVLALIQAHLGRTTAAHAAAAVAVADDGHKLNAANVETALSEVIDAFAGDHFRGNELQGGQHRTIRQPRFGGPRSLLWDAFGIGGVRFRVYIDADSVWFTLNARWDQSVWARDGRDALCSAIRLSSQDITFFHDNAGGDTFTAWARAWRLPMGTAINSAFELTGSVQETGRLGLQFSNANTTERELYCGGTVTFRSRFPRIPSSITLVPTNSNFSGVPIVTAPDRDGFAFSTRQTLAPGANAYWFGSYTAVA